MSEPITAGTADNQNSGLSEIDKTLYLLRRSALSREEDLTDDLIDALEGAAELLGAKHPRANAALGVAHALIHMRASNEDFLEENQ